MIPSFRIQPSPTKSLMVEESRHSELSLCLGNSRNPEFYTVFTSRKAEVVKYIKTKRIKTAADSPIRSGPALINDYFFSLQTPLLGQKRF